jgi:metal-responsive CopG/Arc/MetJ family transcriptional regulator
MTEAIGVRLESDFLKKIENLSKEDISDRSSTIRRLLHVGYQSVMKNRASEEYKQGKISISEAAFKAGLTLWEMEKYLVDQGFVSSYSIEDLQKELEI